MAPWDTLVEDEGPCHADRALQVQTIRLHPADGGEGGAKLGERPGERHVHRIAGQPVARDRVAGHALAFRDLEAHADDPREDHVGADAIGRAQGKNRGQPVVRDPEDHEDDQPDAQRAQPENCQALEQTDHGRTLHRALTLD